MASSDEAAQAASETILSIPLISSQGADAAVAAEAATRAAPLPSAPAAPTPQATSLVAAVLIPIVGPQEVRLHLGCGRNAFIADSLSHQAFATIIRQGS